MLFVFEEGRERKENKTLSRKAPKGTVWESLLGETLKQRRWSILLSSGRNDSCQRQGSEKALFTQGYGDQHTHCLPGGAFLNSERLQHRPGFGGGVLKGGGDGRHLQCFRLSICVYKQLQGSGNCRVKGTRGEKNPNTTVPFKGIKTRRTGQSLVNNSTGNPQGQNPKSKEKRHRQRGI